MKQTAVEYLIEQLNNYDSKMIELFEKEISQAKEMEKQQIIDAYHTGNIDGQIFGLQRRLIRENGEQYYNEKFKK